MDAACRRLVPPLLIAALTTLVGTAPEVHAQVRVNPTGVNVNAQGATTVFLTFGGVVDYAPVDAAWCGEIESAAPAVGVQCVPGTIFGRLPTRFDLSRASGAGALTDIMTIPPSVARRAYQAAIDGANSAFYYVRLFRSLNGGPDQYVAVTCRLTGGGARTPLSLTDVRISTPSEAVVLQVAAGERVPRVDAHITYTGTGRLVGRWEVVLPGEDPPTAEDLLTEGSLPLEQRLQQRRYTPVARFNVFLPPTGRTVLPGPDPSRLPSSVDGAYMLLLRVEASADKEGDSNLQAVGAGNGVVTSGAVAGFPMPVVRYLVGSGVPATAEAGAVRTALTPLSPSPEQSVDVRTALVFSWRPIAEADAYRLDVERRDTTRTAASLHRGTDAHYDAPAWFRERIGVGPVRWRVTAFDATGRIISRTPWWSFTLTAPDTP